MTGCPGMDPITVRLQWQRDMQRTLAAIETAKLAERLYGE